MIHNIMEDGVPDITETPQVFGWGCQRGKIKSKGLNEICGNNRIKVEIILRGPVIYTVHLEKENKELLKFDEWKITHQVDDIEDNNHAVTVIGWSESYWIVKNSWGSDWGINGTGRVPMTNFDCALTANVYKQ